MTPETLILDELDRLGIYYKVQGDNFVVKCLWHEDNKPSLSLHKSGTMARCWGCPWTGNWNMFANEIGAETITADNIDEFHVISAELERSMPRLSNRPDSIPHEHGAGGSSSVIPNSASILYTHEWRGISPEFLNTLDARVWYDDEAESNRILFPVRRSNGKTIGWIAAKEDPKDDSISLKYRNMKDMPVSEVLYPVHLLKGKSVIIVEGPYDAIRLCSYGLPAVAICGSENWSAKKERILVSKGITTVLIAMDGDVAGRRAAGKIAGHLDENFDVTVIDLADGKDPGNMAVHIIEWLGSLLD